MLVIASNRERNGASAVDGERIFEEEGWHLGLRRRCYAKKVRPAKGEKRGMGEHTSDREGEETERQEDSENAHGCGEKGEGRGLKMEIEYKSVLIGVVDRQSLLFVWAAIAVTSTGGKKRVISSRFHASQNSTLHSPAVDKRCEKTREADGQDKGRPFP